MKWMVRGNEPGGQNSLCLLKAVLWLIICFVPASIFVPLNSTIILNTRVMTLKYKVDYENCQLISFHYFLISIRIEPIFLKRLIKSFYHLRPHIPQLFLSVFQSHWLFNCSYVLEKTPNGITN